MTGSELTQYPEEGRKLVLAGHELGNHTYSHSRMILKSLKSVRQEIESTDAAIRKAGYEKQIPFRPPGCKKLFALPYYLRKHNRKTITWDVEPNSFPEVDKSRDRIRKYVVNKVKPGSIILLYVMYKGRQESLEAITGIVKDLRKEGYEFKTVSELLAAKARDAN